MDTDRKITLATDWRHEAKTALAGRAAQIAGMLEAPHAANRLDLKLLKPGTHAYSMRVSLDDRSGYLKLFDRRIPASRAAFETEASALLMLQGSRLIAPLLGIDLDAHLFLSAAGRPLMRAELLAEGRLAKIGGWLARYDEVAPARPACGTWVQFLRTCPETAGFELSAAQAQALRARPVSAVSLARGAAAAQFIEAPNGAIWGVNFDNAALRPRGWDYLMVAIQLSQLTGDPVGVMAGLAAGFAAIHPDDSLVVEMDALCRVCLLAGPGAKASYH